ncbi:tetratricopeptide repeat-containing diguanylate cyclase [Desulfogranum japonicum]|uniref:tetratricopeptide repeat-containing diguanylate cyclase n=1 Tax=Desulfogranum japonicum TaxID=231447 RepID=UPI0004205094|nr:tetratricopeptide repeat protein [Desulfogranum japonicum]
MGQYKESVDHFELLDFVLLQPAFVRQVQRVFPVSTSVEFVFHHDTVDSGYASPVLEDNQVVFLLPTKEQESVLVRCFDYDVMPSQLDANQLQKLQERILYELNLVRMAYIDPVSGMYNRRALQLFETEGAEYSGAFFLLHIVPGSLALQATTSQYLKVLEVLHGQGRGCRFTFGSNLFGMLLFETEHDENLQLARLLLKSLKQERIRRVHIALCCTNSGKHVFTKAWQGISEAERRGPYVIYDSAEQSICPFRQPEKEMLAKLQHAWRGLQEFWIVVAELQEEADVEAALDVVEGALKPHHCARLLWEGKGYFVVQGDSISLPVTKLSAAKEALARTGVEGVGVSQWPGLDTRKNQTVVNALKALLHRTFLEPGTTVCCDALTFNISGDYYFEQGDYRLAAKEYRLGLQMDPENTNLLNSLGVTLTELNQAKGAAKCFKEVLARDSHNFMALVNLGFLQMAQGDKEQALSLLSRGYSCVEKESHVDEELLHSLSSLLMEKENYPQAVKVLKRWAKQSGSNFLVYRLLGINYYKMADFRQASVACQQALNIYPNDNVSLSILGMCYVELGEGVDIGIRLCRQAMDLDSGNAENCIRLAKCLLAALRWDDAVQALPHQIGDPVLKFESYILRARVHLEKKENSEAIMLLKGLKKNNKISLEHRQQVIELLKSIDGE